MPVPTVGGTEITLPWLVLKHRMPEYFSYSTSRGGTKPEFGIFAQKLVE